MIGLVNRSRTALTALSMISALALGACSGDDPEPKLADPSPSASLPSSPSTTAVSGPVEPTMPAEARGTDAAAAEAFVKFYWEMVNYAQATGDTSGLRGLSSGCRPCDSGAAFIESVYGNGGQLTGGVGRVDHTNVGVLQGQPDKRTVVHFKLASTRQLEDYPGTKRDKSYPAGAIDFQVVLEPRSGAWTVVYMGEE